MGHAVVYGAGASVTVFVVAVTAVHLTRALAVSPRRVTTWGAHRGLFLDPRSAEVVRRHLRRKHLARASATVLVGSVSWTLAVLSQPTISFLSLPVVLGVLVAQLLLPEARRGRVRAVALAHRPSSYFAPRRVLVLVRALFAAGLVLSAAGVLAGGRWAAELTVHGAVLLAGLAAMELTLRAISRRGLPDRSDDMALECALRVADARAVVAAGLVMSGIGLWFGTSLALASHASVVLLVFGVVGNVLIPGLVVGAVALTVPLRQWQPT